MFLWVPSTHLRMVSSTFPGSPAVQSQLRIILKELSKSPGNTEEPRTTQTNRNPGTAGKSQTNRDRCCYLSYRTDLCLVRMMEEIQKKINKNQIINTASNSVRVCMYVSYSAAFCCSECLRAAVLSSAGRGRR